MQITAAETIGVEGRDAFYEQTRAFRDMVPNHLFQLLDMIAMEPPNSFDAESVRDKKAEVFDAIQPLTCDDVVFGQYEKGPAGVGYREEQGRREGQPHRNLCGGARARELALCVRAVLSTHRQAAERAP